MSVSATTHERRVLQTGRVHPVNHYLHGLGAISTMRRFLITTETGSVYNVSLRDDGTWWLSAKNVPSLTSVALDSEHEWQIQQPVPWPIVEGQPVLLATLYLTDLKNPLRLPRGGKFTSRVITVSEIGLS